MTTTNLTTDIRHPAEGVVTIDIQGEITSFSEDQIKQTHEAATASNPTAVILNFSGLEYMNSGGIGLLVTTLIRAQRSGHQLLASGLSDHYHEIFKLTRLDEAIGVYSTEPEAIASIET